MEKGEKLTPEERVRAAEIGVYLVNAHGEDSHGWPGSFLKTVMVCLTQEEALQEMERLTLEPGWDEFKIAGPMNLLGLFDYGDITAERAREFLRKIDAGEPHKKLPKPLTPEERESERREFKCITSGTRTGFTMGEIAIASRLQFV